MYKLQLLCGRSRQLQFMLYRNRQVGLSGMYDDDECGSWMVEIDGLDGRGIRVCSQEIFTISDQILDPKTDSYRESLPQTSDFIRRTLP